MKKWPKRQTKVHVPMPSKGQGTGTKRQMTSLAKKPNKLLRSGGEPPFRFPKSQRERGSLALSLCFPAFVCFVFVWSTIFNLLRPIGIFRSRSLSLPPRVRIGLIALDPPPLFSHVCATFLSLFAPPCVFPRAVLRPLSQSSQSVAPWPHPVELWASRPSPRRPMPAPAVFPPVLRLPPTPVPYVLSLL